MDRASRIPPFVSIEILKAMLDCGWTNLLQPVCTSPAAKHSTGTDNASEREVN